MQEVQVNNNEKLINDKIREFFFWIGVLGVLYGVLSVIYFRYPGLQEHYPIIRPIAEPGLKVGSICLGTSVFILNFRKIAEGIVSMIKITAKKIINILYKLMKFCWNRIRLGWKARKSKVESDYSMDSIDRNNDITTIEEHELLNHYALDEEDYQGLNSMQIEAKTAMIRQCFEKFNLDFIEVNDVIEGPTITRYILKLGDGRLNTITSLEKELSMTLGVDRIVIKPSAKGLLFDVPNQKIKKVKFLNTYNKFIKNKKETKILEVPLGQTAVGELLTLDIAKCPHLLIAGATNSGKSVCLNTIICSILLKATPEEVKLILIDPKQVELSDYEHIPHLLTPVIKEIDKAAGALNYVVQEMDKRYHLMKEKGARNIEGYNRKSPEAPLPWIIVVIDELADLIIQVKDDVLDAIQRLGQLARAAGIHVILATQRPSADIVEGRIKANIPGRIAFSVVSNTDSRVILDQAGAEKLLGFGDGMLLTTDRREPERFQGAYISDQEIEEVVNWCKDKYGSNRPGSNLDYHRVIEKSDDLINTHSHTNKATHEDETNEEKVARYLQRLTESRQEDVILLPPTTEMRQKISIRMQDLITILKDLEERKIIYTEGNGKWKRRYIKAKDNDYYI